MRKKTSPSGSLDTARRHAITAGFKLQLLINDSIEIVGWQLKIELSQRVGGQPVREGDIHMTSMGLVKWDIKSGV